MEPKTNNKTITLLCSKSDFAICRLSKAVAKGKFECQLLFHYWESNTASIDLGKHFSANTGVYFIVMKGRRYTTVLVSKGKS